MTGEGTQGLAVVRASSLGDPPGGQGVRRGMPNLSKILLAVLRPKLPPMLPTLLPAIVIRLLFIAFTISINNQLVNVKNNLRYWSLSPLYVLPQIAELCVFILPFLLPQRFPWAAGRFNNICIFIFLLSAWTPVWITEIHYLDSIKYIKWTEKESDNIYQMQITELCQQNPEFSNSRTDECRGCNAKMIFRQTPLGRKNLPFYRCTHGYMFLAIFAQCMLSPWGFNSDKMIVKMCNAADIIELLAYLEDRSTNLHLTLRMVILSLWHISLLQFGFSVTSADVFSSFSIREPQQRPTRIQSNQHNDLPQPGVSDTNEEETTKKPRKNKNKKNKQSDESNSLPEADAETEAETAQAETSVQGEASTQAEASIKGEESAQAEVLVQGEASAQAEASVQARRDCGGHFNCLKGILGEIFVSIMLQDAPFLILRFTLYFAFDMYSQQAVCFTIKNIIFIVVHVVQAVSLLRGVRNNKQ